ncbi:cyclohexanecarboxylate-CoA ligase [Modestobacter sp. DSM 44400]|uniref:AMP-binding protein n=1 Tax=Modestobacter sp. DSM 44400 TaxID=1550230 RepID=UPI000898D6A5|nr:AMP-binding protein [Modestobacter sp. DSM 44400]SDY61424.1 cyclohexanecarboxylate-CoA ligase [Modestobacter sp. DSM 44400]
MTDQLTSALQAPPPATHPGIRADSRLTPELVREYESTGAWRPTPLRSLLSIAAAEHPGRVAAIDRTSGVPNSRRFTYAELDEQAHRYACGLHALGVRAGDFVAVMLPNQADFAALIFAINELGAVYSGIPVAYGEREIQVILRRTGARVVVVAKAFGSNNPLRLVQGLRAGLPSLQHVVVAGSSTGEETTALESLLDAPEVELPEVDARGLCHVGFTSGTTGEPKGVLNTHQTLQAVLENWVAHMGRDALAEPLVNLVASPVGHHTGFLWGVLLTTYLRGTAVYLDRWVPEQATRVIREEEITTMFSAPTFLQDLVLTGIGQDDGCSLRTVVLAGAPVPRTLPTVAGTMFDCYVCPAWGMTELGIGISCAPHLPAATQATDGVPVPGTEVSIVGADGEEVPNGVIGALGIRGAGLFLGYLDLPEATAEAIDGNGWFATGDTARRTEEGYVLLEGRTKDIVIRGGENIPVTVVESLLFQHPDIVEASVIGLPDARLGERACAVVVPSGVAAPTLEEVCGYLLGQGLSKHFLPERLEVVDELPKTPSGKIRKVELRGRYAGS